MGSVVAVLNEVGAHRVLDLGCGEGRLVQTLMRDKGFTKITGVDVSHRALEIASEKLKLERMPERQRERLELFQGSLKSLVRLAREHHCLAAAIVFKLDPKLCHERNQNRPDRNFGPHVVRQQAQQLRRSLRGLKREGVRNITVLESPEDVEQGHHRTDAPLDQPP